MRLSVSNIAWRPEHRDAAYAIMAEAGVTGLEIAPGLTFPDEPDPFDPSDEAVAAFRRDLQRHGLVLTSMQSLLFGSAEAQLFGDAAGVRAFETGVLHAIRLAERLGIPNLVMGSPTARTYPADWSAMEVEARAAEVFGRLGNACSFAGCVLALEPNPTDYGTNFLTTFAETLAFVRRLDHRGVRVNLDLGAVALNDEAGTMMAALPESAALISHVHVSAPYLAPAPVNADALRPVLIALANAGYPGAASIEMRAGPDPLGQLKASLDPLQAAARSIEQERAA